MSTEETELTREEQAPPDIVLPTYRLGPEETKKFQHSKARRIAEEILEGELAGKIDEKWVEEWSDFGDEFEALSKAVADKIKERCKASMDMPRYKLLVQVTVGQRKDQGVAITSRCLWDTGATDNYAIASFQNQHVWASAVVFGMYAD